MKKTTAVAIIGTLLVAIGMRKLASIALNLSGDIPVKYLFLMIPASLAAVAIGVVLIYKNVGSKS